MLHGAHIRMHLMCIHRNETIYIDFYNQYSCMNFSCKQRVSSVLLYLIITIL